MSNGFPLKKGDFSPEVMFFWPFSNKSSTHGERIQWCSAMAEADSHSGEYYFDWYLTGNGWSCGMWAADQMLASAENVSLGADGKDSPMIRVTQAQLIMSRMSNEG